MQGAIQPVRVLDRALAELTQPQYRIPADARNFPEWDHGESALDASQLFMHPYVDP